MEANLYFGFRNLLSFRIGDEYPGTKEGGLIGDVDGEGYADCPNCKKDFYLIVHTRAGKITGADIDPEKPGHVPD